MQLYLELGQFPARFEIMKTRLLFLKCILNENEESMIDRFFKLQLQHMTKGDWAYTCLEDLKLLNISESLENIQTMTKNYGT